MRKKIDRDDLERMLQEGRSQTECAAFFVVSDAAVSRMLKRMKTSELPPSFENLTEKEKRFMLALAEGKNFTEAALEAYDCADRGVAKTLGSRMSKEPEIEVALADIMASEGIPKRRRIQRLRDLIESRVLAAAKKSHKWRQWLSYFCKKGKTQHSCFNIRSKLTINAEEQPKAQIVGI